MRDDQEIFNDHFLRWVKFSCDAWGYPYPDENFYSTFKGRLPSGVRALLTLGLKRGLILPEKQVFTLRGLPDSKGPYNWFSRYTKAQAPSPNWEYFIQVAEFVRLNNILEGKGYTLSFEDGLMDIGIYKDGRLMVFQEAKEKASQVPRLLQGIKGHEDHIDLQENDRGKDSLRKAKYIVKHRPEYFCVFAIGVRREFRIKYPAQKEFELCEDMIPFE